MPRASAHPQEARAKEREGLRATMRREAQDPSTPMARLSKLSEQEPSIAILVAMNPNLSLEGMLALANAPALYPHLWTPRSRFALRWAILENPIFELWSLENVVEPEEIDGLRYQLEMARLHYGLYLLDLRDQILVWTEVLRPWLRLVHTYTLGAQPPEWQAALDALWALGQGQGTIRSVRTLLANSAPGLMKAPHLSGGVNQRLNLEDAVHYKVYCSLCAVIDLRNNDVWTAMSHLQEAKGLLAGGGSKTFAATREELARQCDLLERYVAGERWEALSYKNLGEDVS